MKKLLISMLLVVAIFACGCGSSEKKSKSQTTSDKQKVTPTEAVADNDAVITVEPTKDEENNEVKIKDVYAEYGLKAGTCLSISMINDPKSAELIKSQFNSITCENDMKPDYILDRDASIKAGEIVVKLNDNARKMLDWAKENGMAVRGHTIIWYSQTPKWIFHEDFDVNKDLVGREEMLKRMETFISKVFAMLEDEGYSDIIYAYDVVNEAWMENGTLREDQNYWMQIIGDDYLWHAFYFANKYAPESIDLYYNDYNEQYKSDALVKFVETLVDEDGNYLIDGIGLQAHLYTEDNMDNYFKAVDKLAATGLKIQITELDVSLGSWQKELPASEENFKVQGEYFYNLISGYMDRVKAGTIKSDALTFWGFNDGMSWRRSASPLLYDTEGNAKPAYYGASLQKDKL